MSNNIGMEEQKSSDRGGEVVINVSGGEASKDSSYKEMASRESEKATPFNKRIYPEISSNIPPIAQIHNNVVEGLTQRKPVARSVSLYSRPRSRYGDPTSFVGSSTRGFQNNKSRMSVGSTAPVNPSKEDQVDKKDKVYEEIYKKVKLKKQKRGRWVRALVLIESVFFVVALSALVGCLSIDVLKNHYLWGLEVWKWCMLGIVIFSGMMVTNWFMRLIVFLIESNFLLKRKVLYFVHGLKKSVQVFIWLTFIFVAWMLMFNHHHVPRSHTTTRILDILTRSLISLLTGSFLWLVKTLLMKILAATFHVNNFFDRIQESIFHQYVLQTLSGPRLSENVGRDPTTCQLSFTTVEKGKAKEKKVIDMEKVHKIKREKVSSLTFRVLIDAVRTTGFSSISDTLDQTTHVFGEEEDGKKEITSEMEAKASAYHLFKRVAQQFDYIDEHDLRRFMIKEEVDLVFPLFDGAETTGKITRQAFIDWVVMAFTNRKALAHSLNDTKTAVKQLNKLLTAILIVITIVIWLLLLEVATTKVLLFFSTQLVALAFIVGSSCKALFESIVFVFLMHPYDVGDRCVVDGVPMVVEEMNLLTTVFLMPNNEKVYYPNEVLSKKPISNYLRSPNMLEVVEFSIAFSTPQLKISQLQKSIEEYLDQNPEHWGPLHLVVVNDIENMNKLKMAAICFHTITFQDIVEKCLRRSELCLAIKRVLEDLNIEYTLLPQEVHLTKSDQPVRFFT